MTYESLPFVPFVMAEEVCRRPYTGEEMGGHLLHSPEFIAKVERMRTEMTTGDILTFASEVDDRCRHAYEAKSHWFKRIVNAKGNAGRDQLLTVWIPHWLSSHLARKVGMYA